MEYRRYENIGIKRLCTVNATRAIEEKLTSLSRNCQMAEFSDE